MSEYCNRCGRPHEYGPCLRDNGLRERLVIAAIEALQEGDPTLVIGVGENELRLGWDMAALIVKDEAIRTPTDYETHTDGDLTDSEDAK